MKIIKLTEEIFPIIKNFPDNELKSIDELKSEIDRINNKILDKEIQLKNNGKPKTMQQAFANANLKEKKENLISIKKDLEDELILVKNYQDYKEIGSFGYQLTNSNFFEKYKTKIGKNLNTISEKNIIKLDLNASDYKEEQLYFYPDYFSNTKFALYKKCLYVAFYNDVNLEDEIILKIKSKIYSYAKNLEKLKSEVENLENSITNNDSFRTREPIPEEVRFEVWRRDQGRCVICGSQENLEFDHIIPFSKGGSNTARNLQLLCQKCNRHKSDKI